MQMEELKPLTRAEIEKKIEYFYNILKPYAKDSGFFMSVMIAQVGLESYWGTSTLAEEANNFTGHKFKAPFSNERPDDYYVKDAGESIDGKKVIDKNALWRKYDDVDDWAEHHADWLTQSDWYKNYYADAINAKTPEEQAKELTDTYATDPDYDESLIRIMNEYGLKKYDEERGEKEENVLSKPKIIDRRTQALGYPGSGAYSKRSKSAIQYIVWHYTATTHQGYGADVIKAHERYWRNTHGWDIGGYHYYIDRQGNIFWNYDLEIVSYGAGKINPKAMHISLEASSKWNYTEAQLKAREELTVWLLKEMLPHLGANAVKQHRDFMSTTCAGYTESDMVQFRKEISQKLDSDWGSDSNQVDEIEVAKNGKHTVKHGDTLWAIGQAHDVSVDTLRQWNNIEPGQWLKTGQVIYVVEPKLNAYTVVKGDYLWKIANENGVTVEQLKDWNNLPNNYVYVGQELFVSDPSEELGSDTIEKESLTTEKDISDNEEVEEIVVEELENDEPTTLAIELEENQYLRWDGSIIEVKVVSEPKEK